MGRAIGLPTSEPSLSSRASRKAAVDELPSVVEPSPTRTTYATVGATQTPAEHVDPKAQMFPHAPQFSGSLPPVAVSHPSPALPLQFP